MNREWSREELILLFSLYCRTAFGKMHQRNPDVIHFARLIGRTPSAVAYKLVNFASFDPKLTERGVRGAVNSSKLDRAIWDEFFENWDKLVEVSNQILENMGVSENVIQFNEDLIDGINPITRESENYTLKKNRLIQSFFRQSILASYNSTCCITGIKQPEVLIASHIVPWSIDVTNRANPANGILLNALHDKLFDRGLLTINADYTIRMSSRVNKDPKNSTTEWLSSFNGFCIHLPSKFIPDSEFLEFHRTKIFVP